MPHESQAEVEPRNQTSSTEVWRLGSGSLPEKPTGFYNLLTQGFPQSRHRGLAVAAGCQYKGLPPEGVGTVSEAQKLSLSFCSSAFRSVPRV